MRERIRKGIGMDVSHMPRILVVPIFGGWEPAVHEIIYELGGRILYADWECFNLLEEISTAPNTDPIEEYARYLLKASKSGLECDKERMSDSYLETARKLNVDGIIFFESFGCNQLSNSYTILKEKARKELEIPTTSITFKKIGESIDQMKTKIGAFMEMV